MLKDLPVQLIELFLSLGTMQAYALILIVLLLCGFGLPIPEDITLISAGILASSGSISIEGALFISFFGVMLGDSTLFFLGKKYGRKVYTWPLFNKVFTPERVEKAETRIRRNAKYICFIARFMPGLRAPIFLTAGTMGVRSSTFLLADGSAALFSVPIWVFLGNWFGDNIDLVLATAKKVNYVLLIILAVLIIGFFIYRKFRKPHTNSIT